MNRRRLATYAFIAKFFIGHHLSRLWQSRSRAEGGLEKFLNNYREDHILPLRPDERAAFHTFQACVSCGLCTAECMLGVAPGRLSGAPRIDPRTIAVAYSRSVPEFWSAGELLERCKECGFCEEICPTDTPLRRLVRFMSDKIGDAAGC